MGFRPPEGKERHRDLTRDPLFHYSQSPTFDLNKFNRSLIRSRCVL
jgi:hypothetical protein